MSAEGLARLMSMSTPVSMTNQVRVRSPRRWVRWVLTVLVVVLFAGLTLRLWARAELQKIMDEVWRCADEGKEIVAAIEKYRADKGEFPPYVAAGKPHSGPLESLYPDYVRQPVPYYWYFEAEDSRASLSRHFAFVEWMLDYDFSTQRWTFNGEPLDRVPRKLPYFPR